MKIRIVKPTRIEKGKAGDIVEVSEDRAKFLIGFNLAVPAVRQAAETPEKKTARKTTRTRK